MCLHTCHDCLAACLSCTPCLLACFFSRLDCSCCGDGLSEQHAVFPFLLGFLLRSLYSTQSPSSLNTDLNSYSKIQPKSSLKTQHSVLRVPAGSQAYPGGSGYNSNEGNTSYGQGSYGGQVQGSNHPQSNSSSSVQQQQYGHSNSSSIGGQQYGYSSSSSPGAAPNSNYGGQYGQNSPSPPQYGQPGNYDAQYGQGGGAQGTLGSAGGAPNWPNAPQWNP